MRRKKVIIGFEYCENDLEVMGVFKDEESFMDFAINRKQDKAKITNIKRKTENSRLVWDMDVIFNSELHGFTHKYGYRTYDVK